MIRRILLCCCLVLLASSCHKAPPDVPPDQTSCDYPAGNRNFTWRLDTVAWFPSTVGGVWAFSDNDAYVMGNIVDGKPPYDLRPGRHWNGTAWEDNINGTPDEIKHTPNDVNGDASFMVSVGYWGYGSSTGVTIAAALAEFDNRTKKWTGYQFQTPGELRAVWTDRQGFFVAGGDGGIVFTKDGYAASWSYSQIPTNSSIRTIVGISKTELYASTYLSTTGGLSYQQLWEWDGTNWRKLFDNFDTTGNAFELPVDNSDLTSIASYRCPVTDSLQIYLLGRDSYLLKSEGKSLAYSVTNLSTLGLPLSSLGRTAVTAQLFSPNDFWIASSSYDFFQWNGIDFQRITIPGLPSPGSFMGFIQPPRKTGSGKLFLPCQIAPQVYVVCQGVP